MKKILALLCALALILSVFSACSKDEEKTVQGSTSQQSTSTENSTDSGKNESSASDKNEGNSDNTTESTTAKTERTAFPAFDTEDIFGAKVSSKIFAEKKLTLVNTFTTWCGPCKQELPDLAKLSEELEDIGFIGIVIDINEGDGISETALRDAKDLCNDANAKYPYLVADEPLIKFCRDIYSIPTTYFVDKDGKIVGDPVTGAKSAERWKEIIEQKLSML